MSRLDASGEAGTWNLIVDAYLSGNRSSEIEGILAPLRTHDPLHLTTAIDANVAEHHKAEIAGFVLTAIGSALADHTLSDAEVHVLRHLCRALRIREGDLLANHREAVVNVLAQELQRLLEDDLIDPVEAIHKVKLQEILGLSYDEFVTLTAPEVERVFLRLLRRVDASLGPADLAKNIHWFRNCMAALDTVYDFMQSTCGSSVAAMFISWSIRRCPGY